MARFKELLIAHGEKAGLLLVLIFAGWSMVGNLFFAGSEEIDSEEIQSNIRVIKEQLQKKKTSTGREEIKHSRNIVRNILDVYAAPVWRCEGWDTHYILPPVPEKIEVIEPPEKSLQAQPPEEYLASIDQAEGLKVYVGGKRLVIVFRESAAARGLRNVRAVIWRKYVGDGKPGAALRKLSEKKPESRVEGRADAGYGKGRAGIPDMPGMPGYGKKGYKVKPVRKKVRTVRVKTGNPALTEGFDLARRFKASGQQVVVDSVDNSFSEAEAAAANLKAEELFYKDVLAEILDSSTLEKNSWKLVAKDLAGLAEEPDWKALLEGEKPQANSASGFSEGEYQQKWFAFVDEYNDDNIVENAIYRYRVVFYAKAALLPAELKGDEKYRAFKPYVRVGNQRLALPLSEFETQLKNIDKPKLYAKASQLKIRELTKREGFNAEGQTISFLDVPGNLKKREYKLLRKRLAGAVCYSPFAFSEYVLTPVRTTMAFKSGFTGTGVFQVSVVEDNGERVSQIFMVKTPELPEKSRKLARNPYKKYPLKEVKPTPIGIEKKVQGIKYDFRTGWGLVDIKNCKVTVKYYAKQVKRDKDGRDELDAEGNAIMVKVFKSATEFDSKYAVIRELKGKGGKPPRFKRIIQYRKPDELQEVITPWNKKAKTDDKTTREKKNPK